MALTSEDDWTILGLDRRQDVLEAIFRASDLQSLKNFRLVCHLWNKEVLRILGEKCYIPTRKGSLSFLHTTLDSCPTPQYLFTSLEIQLCGDFNKTLKHILKKYGVHLKSLRFTGDIKQTRLLMADGHNNTVVSLPDDITHVRSSINITSKILKKWCPSLKSIRFDTSFLTQDCKTITANKMHSINTNPINPRYINLFDSFPSSVLRLTSIELDGFMISSQRSYCLQLLLISPELTRLRISFGRRLVKGVPEWVVLPNASLFFMELKNRPEITKRLKKLVVIGLKVPQLTDAISELEFSPDNFTSIGISGCTNVSDPEFHKFVDLLHKLKKLKNLEKLTIFKCSCSSCEWRNWREKSRWRDIEQTIPVMMNIRHLDISSNGTHGIASLSLLNKFPTLHTLEFSLCRVGHANPDYHRDNISDCVDFDYFFNDWIYLKRTAEYGDVLRSNCSSINTLTIHHTLQKLESLRCMQECFPNLTKLTICIRSSVQYCWEVYMECKLSLSSCLDVLATLRKLEELYIMMPKGVIYPKQEISRALKILRDFPELRRFNLTLGPPEYSPRAPYRCRDASDPTIQELFSEYVVSRETHRFRSLTITVLGICCCKVSKQELDDIRNVMTSYKHGYRFNWCCNQSARILARYGNKRYEYSPKNE